MENRESKTVKAERKSSLSKGDKKKKSRVKLHRIISEICVDVKYKVTTTTPTKTTIQLQCGLYKI